MRTPFHAIIGLLILGGTGFAGEQWSLRCTTPVCGLSTNINIGGGFTFRTCTGYCTNCRQFVTVQTPRDTPIEQPDISTNVPAMWNPKGAAPRDSFRCPGCTTLVMDVTHNDLCTTTESEYNRVLASLSEPTEQPDQVDTNVLQRLRDSRFSGTVVCPNCGHQTLNTHLEMFFD